MAQIPLLNLQTFLMIRTSLNSMFTEIYAAILTLTQGNTAAAAAAAAANANANTRVSLALAWNGTVPALQSGVNPFPAFNSNAFEYTGTSTATLDGSVFYPGDLAIFGAGGSNTYSRVPAGGSFLGIFVNSAAQPAAAANASNIALVGTAPPYAVNISNGQAWITIGSGGATTLASLTDIAAYDLGTNNPSVAAIKATANAALPASQKGAANGVATLDSGLHLPAAQLPAIALANLSDGAAQQAAITAAGSAAAAAQATANAAATQAALNTTNTNVTAAASAASAAQATASAAVPSAQKGVSGGVATLDTLVTVPIAQIVRTLASSNTVALTGQTDYAPLTIAGPTTIAVSGTTRGAQASMTVVADGTNIPTITGADEWASSFGYLNTSGVPNRLDTWFDGISSRFAWSQQAVPLSVYTALVSAVVTGASLVLTYNQALNTTAPAASAFTVVGAGGGTQTPTAVSISGSAVTLTLGTPAANGNTVTVSYAVPGTNPIQSAGGQLAAALTSQATTNSTPAAPALTAAAVSGASLTLTYSQTLATTAPAASAFSVVGAGGTTQAPSAVSIAGAIVTLTLGTPAVNGNTVTISYSPPGTNPVQNTTGQLAAALSSQAVTNTTGAAPALQSAAVNGTSMTLTYNQTLNATAPAASSYSVVGAGGATQTPTATSIAGQVVTLTLATAATSANTVTVSYTPGTNPVQNAGGQQSAALTNQAVTNNTAGQQAETTAWLSRVATAGGTVSTATQNAVDAFVAGCKSDGTFSLMRRLNLVCGDYPASQVPLVNSSGSTQETMTSMTSADYAEATGWTTDGTSKSVNTGYTPSESTGGTFAYLRTTQASDTNGRCLLGAQSASVGFRVAGNRDALGNSSAGSVSGIWGGQATTAGNQTTTTGGMLAGMWHDSRSASTAQGLYFNGTSVSTTTASVTPVSPGVAITVMAVNNAGTITNYLTSGSRIAAYGVDTGMSAAQAASFYARMQTFQTTMGRNV